MLSAVHIVAFAIVLAPKEVFAFCINLMRVLDTFVDVAFAVLLRSVIRARVRAGNEIHSIAFVIADAVFMTNDTSVVALVVTFAVLPRTINIPPLAFIVA